MFLESGIYGSILTHYSKHNTEKLNEAEPLEGGTMEIWQMKGDSKNQRNLLKFVGD